MNLRRTLLLLLLLGLSFYFFIPSSQKTTKKIPVLFKSPSFTPTVKMSIDGKKFFSCIDSGASKKLYIGNNIQKKICPKPLAKEVVSYDFKGNSYRNPIYVISGCEIGPFLLNNYEVIQEGLDFYQNTSLSKQKRIGLPNYHARIGCSFFDNQCVLFDFTSSAIYTAETLDDLVNDGLFCANQFHPVPLQMIQGLPHIQVKTDLGELRMVLDTGASWGILSQKILPDEKMTANSGIKTYRSKSVIINGYDFLDWEFAVSEISDNIGIDGCLGIDFFIEYPICLDFKNHMAYIQKPKGILGTQWKRGRFYVTQFLTKYSSEFSNMEEL